MRDDYGYESIASYRQEVDRLKSDKNKLRQLLELTQDSARMAAVVTDPRAMMTPGKAVEAFNRYFPEIKRLLDGTDAWR